MKRKTVLFSLLGVFALGMMAACSKDDDGQRLSMVATSDLVRLQLVGTGTVTIDWGDGTSTTETFLTGGSRINVSNSYSSPEPRIITLSGAVITILACNGNQLTSLDISRGSSLVHLYCQDNRLTSLDISKNTLLNKLECNDNQLTNLEASKNKALNYLDCSNNKMDATALDDLFKTLPMITSFDTVYNIRVAGNPGAPDCDWKIAAARGWSVSYKY